jgi:hypothetical protein
MVLYPIFSAHSKKTKDTTRVECNVVSTGTSAVNYTILDSQAYYDKNTVMTSTSTSITYNYYVYALFEITASTSSPL